MGHRLFLATERRTEEEGEEASTFCEVAGWGRGARERC